MSRARRDRAGTRASRPASRCRRRRPRDRHRRPIEQDALEAEPGEGEPVGKRRRRPTRRAAGARDGPLPCRAAVARGSTRRVSSRQGPSGDARPARDRASREARSAGTPRDRPGIRTPTSSSSRPRTTCASKYSRAISTAARRARAVVGVDALDRGDRLVEVAKAKSASPVGSTSPKPVSCVTTGRPGGEVGGAAVAEPAGAQADVLVLGDGELAARRPDVVAVGVEVGREVERGADAPAARLEQLAVRGS